METRQLIAAPEPRTLMKWKYQKPWLDSTAFQDLEGHLGELVDRLLADAECLAHCCEALNRIQPQVDTGEAEAERLWQAREALSGRVEELEGQLVHVRKQLVETKELPVRLSDLELKLRELSNQPKISPHTPLVRWLPWVLIPAAWSMGVLCTWLILGRGTL